jgi:cytochrome P450
VRIAPDELSYTAPQCWKDIYGHRIGQPENYKDPSENFTPGQAQSIIFADKAKHSQLRRLLSNAFSEKTLRDQEPVLRHYADLLIQRLSERCGGGSNPVDLVKWYNVSD